MVVYAGRRLRDWRLAFAAAFRRDLLAGSVDWSQFGTVRIATALISSLGLRLRIRAKVHPPSKPARPSTQVRR